MAKCRECGKGDLVILGTGYLGDLIEVECQNPECNEIYEVEPDGLGDGGFEFVEAQMIELDKNNEQQKTSNIGHNNNNMALVREFSLYSNNLFYLKKEGR